MKITVPATLSSNDFPNEDDNFYRLLSYFQQHRFETIQLSRNNITFTDNVLIQEVNYKFTHGVKVAFANNLKTKPVGLVPVAAIGAAIDACELTIDNTGKTGITVYFKTQKTNLFLTRSANQSIPNATVTAIIWDINNIQEGAGLKWLTGTNPTRITCVTPGTYLFSYVGAYESNAVGIRAFTININGVATGTFSNFADQSLINNGVQIFQTTGSVPLELKTDDFIEVNTFQNSGGALNLLGHASQEVQLSAISLEYSLTNIPCVIYVLG